MTALLPFMALCSCGDNVSKEETKTADSASTTMAADAAGYEDTTTLPPPFATKSVRNAAKVIGWSEGTTPVAPAGFTVSKFADSLDNPRWIYVAPNGDIFIAESATESKGVKRIVAKISGKAKSQNTKSQNVGESANRITLFRDSDKNGIPEKRYVYLRDLAQPFGMLVLNNKFYVACTDGLLEFPYNDKATSISVAGKKIVTLPAGGYNNHWTRNVVTNKAGNKLYITVGSGSNVAEHGIDNEIRRANILEVNPDGSDEKIFASGLRNPVGLDWAPGTNTLWTAVNERDQLGDELVPDYITSVKEGAFYGWPYSYFGQNEDPRMKENQNMDLVKKAIKPDVPVGSHTASLGLTFYDRDAFPSHYKGGAFVSQHGSWNRSELSGYKVIFVPFNNGKPSGKPEDFLTGFISQTNKNEVYGRPVGLAILDDGSMLVSDDASNTIWRITASKQ